MEEDRLSARDVEENIWSREGRSKRGIKKIT
jgi:hypothetical protein